MKSSSQHRPRVLLLATGSVAAVKVPALAFSLASALKAEVRIILTDRAHHFYSTCSEAYDPDSWKAFNSLDPPVEILRDEDEWRFSSIGQPVLHVEAGVWADLLLVAPLSANTLAKMANGLCDNLATCVARAWEVSKAVILCPAMNTRMWSHPLTAQHLQSLQSFLLHSVVLDPVVKVLACGDVGQGAMTSVPIIVECVRLTLLNQGFCVPTTSVSPLSSSSANLTLFLDQEENLPRLRGWNKLKSDACSKMIFTNEDETSQGFVYDLGCGIGVSSCLLAKELRTSVVGIDISKQELEYAAKKKTSFPVSFINADIRKLGELQKRGARLKGNAAGIFCSFVAANLSSDLNKSVTAWRNLLKENGWMLFIEINGLFSAHKPLSDEQSGISHADFVSLDQRMLTVLGYDAFAGRKLSACCSAAGLSVVRESVWMHDSEFGFDGVASPAALSAWKQRLARPDISDHFEQHFKERAEQARDTFMRCLSSAQHVCVSKPRMIVAMKTTAMKTTMKMNFDSSSASPLCNKK